MLIDLPRTVEEHLTRAINLADEATIDNEQGFAARAAALSPLTSMIKELTKTQQQIINMDSLLQTERVIVETVKEYLTEEQLEYLIEKLDAALQKIPS